MDPNYVAPAAPVNPVAPPAQEIKPEQKIPPAQVVQAMQEERSSGPIIAIIIIVLILIAGGFYLWQSGIMKKSAPAPVVTPTAEVTVPDDIANIEASLGGIDVSSDTQLNQLETQF
ncbi:MAG: hypothetical protein WC835_00800 [Candidatus Paceibacterota bacterium]|jgi:hypothetical protein